MLRALLATVLLALVAPALASVAAPVAGEDYVEIPGGQPFAPSTGRIEVAEVFGYVCPHCAHFEPILAAWQRKQPADVQLSRIPAPFGGYWAPYARAYFAAEQLGVAGKTHQAMFDALHAEHTLPIQNVSLDELAAFYARFGVKPEAFAQAIRGPKVDAQIKRSADFLTRCEIDQTPTLVVAGRYKVIGGRSFDDFLRIADWLVARERARIRGTRKK